jgi:F-type H+-transporting ATPase subunit gamma
MEEIERAQERLQHIRSVEPILDALRMIALGSWQKATKQQTVSQQYSDRLLAVLPWLLPHLPQPRRPVGDDEPQQSVRRVVVVVGSERGLCGRFNMDVAAYADEYLTGREAQGESVTVAALGSRVIRLLVGGERPLAWSQALSATTLPPLSSAFSLTQQWLAQFEENEIDAVTCVHNVYTGMGSYRSTVTPLLPPPLPKKRPLAETWPPPIIETAPETLYTQIVQQWTAVRYYQLLLQSTMAEQSVRYQLMESAGQNTERLLDELSAVVQAARQQAITREMQALAVGAGLVGAREME